MDHFTKYVTYLNAGFPELLPDIVDRLSNAERIELREKLEKSGCTLLVQNLFFNYQTQEWI